PPQHGGEIGETIRHAFFWAPDPRDLRRLLAARCAWPTRAVPESAPEFRLALRGRDDADLIAHCERASLASPHVVGFQTQALRPHDGRPRAYARTGKRGGSLDHAGDRLKLRLLLRALCAAVQGVCLMEGTAEISPGGFRSSLRQSSRCRPGRASSTA